MHFKRRYLLLFFLVFLCFIKVNAKASKPTTGEFGKNVTWTYDASTKTLTISGTGSTYDYSHSTFEDRLFYRYYKNDIQTVVIENGVTRLGDYSLCMLHSCTTVVFKGNTLNEIGEDSFWQSGLTSLTIPQSVNKLGKGAFEVIRSLSEVSVPSSIQDIPDGLFFDSKIKVLKLEERIRTIGTDILGKSTGCKLYIPNSVTKINEDAFPQGYKIVVCGYNDVARNAALACNNQYIDLNSSYNIQDLDYKINYYDNIYHGTPVMPTVSVEMGDIILTEGIDYSLSYSNNNSVGHATLAITGIAPFTGTKNISFDITGNMSDSLVTLNDTTTIIYDGVSVGR